MLQVPINEAAALTGLVSFALGGVVAVFAQGRATGARIAKFEALVRQVEAYKPAIDRTDAFEGQVAGVSLGVKSLAEQVTLLVAKVDEQNTRLSRIEGRLEEQARR